MKQITDYPIPQSEDQLQSYFWEYVWNNYPQLQHHIWAVPNSAIGHIQSAKDQKQANLLKATGTLAGVWDLHCYWYGKYHIIETKIPGNQLTVDRLVKNKSGQILRKVYGQKEWGERMAAHGAIRHIYHSLEEGMEIIKSIINNFPISK